MTAEEIGISNAQCAFDFAADYGSLDAAIASFYENIQDTLIDAGMASDEAINVAQRAFERRVDQLRADLLSKTEG